MGGSQELTTAVEYELAKNKNYAKAEGTAWTNIWGQDWEERAGREKKVSIPGAQNQSSK